MSAVVSDTSPIRALAHLGLLSLPHDLYGVVYVPPQVAAELAVVVPALPVVRIHELSGYLVHPVSDRRMIAEFAAGVDPGEAEAIALALELKAEIVLMDDLRGRRLAMQHGLTPVGVLGMLLDAKVARKIARIAPLIDRLEREMSFRVSVALRRRVLAQAGELGQS